MSKKNWKWKFFVIWRCKEKNGKTNLNIKENPEKSISCFIFYFNLFLLPYFSFACLVFLGVLLLLLFSFPSTWNEKETYCQYKFFSTVNCSILPTIYFSLLINFYNTMAIINLFGLFISFLCGVVEREKMNKWYRKPIWKIFFILRWTMESFKSWFLLSWNWWERANGEELVGNIVFLDTFAGALSQKLLQIWVGRLILFAPGNYSVDNIFLNQEQKEQS